MKTSVPSSSAFFHIAAPSRPGAGLVPFSAVCNCPSGRRRPPIRFNRQVAATLVQYLPAHTSLGSYRCSACQSVVALTVGSLDLAAPATS